MTTSQMYRDIELSTEVEMASKHRQIQMLFERCLREMQFAKAAIISNDMPRRHKAIARASDIMNYLRVCLNFKNEKTLEMSKLLDINYMYVEKCLLAATLKNDAEAIDRAHDVLATIKSGWDGIASLVE